MNLPAGPLTLALESAWRAIQAEWQSVPDAVIIIGAGTRDRKRQFHGYFHADQWHDRKDAESKLHEVCMAGESFERSAEETFGTLLHEAVHAWCSAKGIADTSRNGRYHNARFKSAAEKMGLRVSMLGSHGWAKTELPHSTNRQYVDAIQGIREALTVQRKPFAHAQRAAQPSTDYVKCECHCAEPNVVRMSRALADQCVVRCDECEEPFDAC